MADCAQSDLFLSSYSVKAPVMCGKIMDIGQKSNFHPTNFDHALARGFKPKWPLLVAHVCINFSSGHGNLFKEGSGDRFRRSRVVKEDLAFLCSMPWSSRSSYLHLQEATMALRILFFLRDVNGEPNM